MALTVINGKYFCFQYLLILSTRKLLLNSGTAVGLREIEQYQPSNLI